MSSAICFNLDQSKILLSGNGISLEKTEHHKNYPCKILSTATLVVDEISNFQITGLLVEDEREDMVLNTSTKNSTITDRRKLLPAPKTPEIPNK